MPWEYFIYSGNNHVSYRDDKLYLEGEAHIVYMKELIREDLSFLFRQMAIFISLDVNDVIVDFEYI